MKNISSIIYGILFSVLIIANSAIFGQEISSETLPNLRGEKAIKKLKENGQYDSLMDAVKSAQKKDGQTDELPTTNAIGQNIRLTASDGSTTDKFGVSVAISGDTAIIGSYLDDIGTNAEQGSAYIFVRNGTTWDQQAKITAADGAAGDRFGIEVAIYNNTVIVGSYLDDVGINTDQGSAYIYARTGSLWIQQTKLTVADGAANDQLGYGVSLYGNTAIVGSYSDDIGTNANQGSAYVFVGSGATWTQQAKLTASDGAADDAFGIKLTLNGDTLIVGSPNDDVGTNANQGSVYIFVRNGTTWTQQAKLTASDGAANDQFGFSVSISGETAIVGVYADDIGANADQGSAYIFVRNATIWTQQAKIINPEGAANARFGLSVAISGNTIVIGSQFENIGEHLAQGSADVYIKMNNGTWERQTRLISADGLPIDTLGNCVAIDNNNILVGASLDDVGANTDQGSVYAFRFLSQTWSQESQKVASDGAADDQFGGSVSISGDTAIVGSVLDDIGTNAEQGSAYIFVRTGTTWTQQAKLIASNGTVDDRFGVDVAIYGDTAIVGANRKNVGVNSNQGSAYIFVRNGTTWTQQAELNASDGGADDQFGFGVTVFGDTALVGAYADDVAANTDQGSVYVYTRSGTTWTQQTKLTASDGAADDQFGVDLELNGNTVVIGAYLDDIGTNIDQGSTYVFVRSGAIWTQQAKLTASDGVTNDFFGRDVAISGDTAIVGAYFDDVGTVVGAGSAYVFTRTGTTWTQQQKLTASDGGASDFFGINVAISGDTVIIGASQDDIGTNTNQGSAYFFTRVNGVWLQQQKLTAPNGAVDDLFGVSVAVSGDKFLVGAWLSDSAVSNPLTENSKDNFAPTAVDQGTAYFFINNLLPPTAAGVSVSGRVLTANGRGLRNATVSLTKANGETISTTTSAFGYYSFDNVEAAQTIVISINSKRFHFQPQVVSLTESLSDLNFIAME